MTRETFNTGWEVRTKVTPFQELGGSAGEDWVAVTLPHDALIRAERNPDAPEGHTNGYFDGGAFEYRRSLAVSDELRGKLLFLEFDGVYRDAVVTVNGALAGRWANGYSRFVVRIDPFLHFGAENDIRVACRTHLDSRWYAGAGIHRDVHLIVKDALHFAVDGIQVTTPDIDDEFAAVHVAIPVENSSGLTQTARASVAIVDASGAEVATAASPVTLLPGDADAVRLRMLVPEPLLWSAESPNLYSARLQLSIDGSEVDDAVVSFGIRSIQVDAQRGLRVNGSSVKLRGACIHSDNGPLGAAAIAQAEERKIALLKAAGFNAIRSAHNACSSALLEACDRLGMYVMDETFDMWTQGKSDFDYSADFPIWWEKDLEALVAKDFNHPSVIFYSIGNENPETGSADGGRWSRRLAEKLRSLDSTRLVTNGINGFVSALDMVLGGMKQRRDAAAAAAGDGTVAAPAQAGGVNGMMNAVGEMMGQIVASPPVSARTEESFAVLDVAGMNYGASRYELDRELFPNRVIVGTETWPSVIDHNWALVKDNPHVIGDFTWTGIDYLGEVGIGVVGYGDSGPRESFATPYPGLTAYCGDLDIAGHRRPQSYYREIVFGLRTAPFIAVQRPERYDAAVTMGTPWSWSDTVSSWSWPGHQDAPIRVEVYADADEVELLLDGESIARAAVGTERAFRADFDMHYRPGELTAVAYRQGIELDRSSLVTANDTMRLHVDGAQEIRCHTGALAFLEISSVDDSGTLHTGADLEVRVTVEGAGDLAALGTGAPVTAETFHSPSRRMFDGRAVAIVRPTGVGTVVVTVEADGCAPVVHRIEVVADGDEAEIGAVAEAA